MGNIAFETGEAGYLPKTNKKMYIRRMYSVVLICAYHGNYEL